MMRFLALAALLLLLSGHAAAQSLPVQPVSSSVAVSTEDPGRAFQPGQLEPVAVLVSYTPAPGARPSPSIDPNSANTTAPTQVTLEVKSKPSWVREVTFVPPILNFSMEPTPNDPAGKPQPTRAIALLNVTPDAPALAREEFIVIAKAAPNGNIAPSQAESASINLRAAVVTKINLTAPRGPFIVQGGRGVHIPFVVKNLGNSNVTARLNVTSRPQDSVYEVPATIDLPRNGTGSVDVILRLPWTYGEAGTVELEATPITENDDGKPVHADVDVAGQSAVPGVPLVAIAGIFFALALTRRRSR